MLYALYGADFKKRVAKQAELINFFLKKKPDASVAEVAPENFAQVDLDELSLSQGIFERKNIVVLKGLLEDKELREDLLEKLPALAKSENIFIVNERELLTSSLKALKENSEKIQEFALKEKPNKPAFNIFSLSDAVGKRDKRASWAILLKALKSFEPEEVHGTIFWQVKSMILSKTAASAESAGLKPFVFSKSKRYAENYSGDELKNFSSGLISLYHDSHRGIVDFSLGLEKLILETV